MYPRRNNPEGRSTSEIVRLTKMTRHWVFKYRRLHTGERERRINGRRSVLSSENRSLIMSFISNFPRITLKYALTCMDGSHARISLTTISTFLHDIGFSYKVLTVFSPSKYTK